jgi:hypothetical protein
VTRGDQDDAIHPVAHAVEVHAEVARAWLWIAPNTPFSALRFRPEAFLACYEAFLGEAADAEA